jgi:hypothetical protein
MEDVGIFTAVWYIIGSFGIFEGPFGIFNGHLVYFSPIWYVVCSRLLDVSVFLEFSCVLATCTMASSVVQANIFIFPSRLPFHQVEIM